MPSGSGITADTPANIVVGAGLLLREHAIFGASIENNRFAVEREMFVPELNGLMGMLMGTDFIIRSNPTIESTIPEVGANVITAGIPGSSVDTSTPGMAVISDATARRLADSAYADWELDVERKNGGQFQFEIDNALNTAGFDSELQDAGVYAPRYTLQGRRSAASPDTSNWRIRILDVAS